MTRGAEGHRPDGAERRHATCASAVHATLRLDFPVGLRPRHVLPAGRQWRVGHGGILPGFDANHWTKPHDLHTSIRSTPSGRSIARFGERKSSDSGACVTASRTGSSLFEYSVAGASI